MPLYTMMNLVILSCLRCCSFLLEAQQFSMWFFINNNWKILFCLDFIVLRLCQDFLFVFVPGYSFRCYFSYHNLSTYAYIHVFARPLSSSGWTSCHWRLMLILATGSDEEWDKLFIFCHRTVLGTEDDLSSL